MEDKGEENEKENKPVSLRIRPNITDSPLRIKPPGSSSGSLRGAIIAGGAGGGDQGETHTPSLRLKSKTVDSATGGKLVASEGGKEAGGDWDSPTEPLWESGEESQGRVSLQDLKEKITELEEKIVETNRSYGTAKASLDQVTSEYEAEVNRRTTAEMMLRDLTEQERILEMLGLFDFDFDFEEEEEGEKGEEESKREVEENEGDGERGKEKKLCSFQPSEEQFQQFWDFMSAERKKILDLQTLNEDLEKRAFLLSKERGMYQRQKEQLQSLVVSYLREKGDTADSTTKQQLQSLYHIYVMEERCRSIFSRPTKDLPVHIDIPRLARSFDVLDKQGVSLFSPPPTSEGGSVGVCVKLLFVILTRELEGEERELEVGEVYEELVPMGDSYQKDDFQKKLLSFLQHPKIESLAATTVLKACNQAIIAPYVTRLKNAMDDHLPFNSARNGWTIAIKVGTEKILVTHIKREVAAPDAIDSFGAFEFEWKMEIGLERESMTIQNTFAGIESIDLGIEEMKDEAGKQFFHNDMMEFKDLLRTCISSEETQDLDKKIKRLKEKIHRKQSKYREKERKNKPKNKKKS